MEEPKSTLTLFEGDCLDIFSQIKDGSIDMVLCDPPYGITKAKWDSVIDLEKMWTCLKRVCKPNAAIVFFAAQPFASMLIFSNKKEFKQELIWEKNRAANFLNARKQHLTKHENILVFYKTQCVFNHQFTDGEAYMRPGKDHPTEDNLIYNGFNQKTTTYEAKRYPLSVLKYDKVTNNYKSHASEKPVDLLEYLVKTYSNKNDTVLDFTMGSGSTGVACKNTKRNFIGIEKNSEFFKLASERLNMVEDDWKKQLKEKYKNKIKKRKIEKETK